MDSTDHPPTQPKTTEAVIPASYTDPRTGVTWTSDYAPVEVLQAFVEQCVVVVSPEAAWLYDEGLWGR